eukprot:766157-Pelagomonas_calceolata.AAC.1
MHAPLSAATGLGQAVQQLPCESSNKYQCGNGDKLHEKLLRRRKTALNMKFVTELVARLGGMTKRVPQSSALPPGGFCPRLESCISLGPLTGTQAFEELRTKKQMVMEQSWGCWDYMSRHKWHVWSSNETQTTWLPHPH